MYRVCQRCGRPLTDPESQARGYGPECYEKEFGVSVHGIRHHHTSHKEVPENQLSLFDNESEAEQEDVHNDKQQE